MKPVKHEEEHEEEQEGQYLTGHKMNRAHAKGLKESGEILGPAMDGNILLNQMHEMYVHADGEALLHEEYAVTDGETMLHGGMPSADDEQCVNDCLPKHEGARKTNRMILDSYGGVSER